MTNYDGYDIDAEFDKQVKKQEAAKLENPVEAAVSTFAPKFRSNVTDRTIGMPKKKGEQTAPLASRERPLKSYLILANWSIVLAILLPPIGLIMSVFAFLKARRGNLDSTRAIVGLVLGVVGTIAGTISLFTYQIPIIGQLFAF